ncbi:Gfo/Idh/MocA family oxidoreductase [Planctomycetales bacterium ZRK34]|nr:Gfo/Idh/MocA family oxidoreductase [Planctomycetales bacterium ZRK34]
MTDRFVSRRTFVSHIAAGMSLPAVMPRVVRAASANGIVRHACIGAGGMAWVDMNQFKSLAHLKIVAICDVDAGARNRAVEKVAPDAIVLTDWRELFDKHADAFDSVNVTIPDHMHAPVAMRALAEGKHLYCQKPMTKWLQEMFKLSDAAGRSKVVTQLGIQNHARTEFRLARWAMREKVLGKIKEVHGWSNKTWGGPRKLPEPVDPPASLDWNGWIGVAPMRPYAPKAYHPGQWRDWVDFGTGLLGDMACHVLDAPIHAMKLGAPKRIESAGPAPTTQNWPDRATVHFDFDGNEFTAGDTLRLTWYDGQTKAPGHITEQYPHRLPQTGCVIVGERGSMLIPHVAAPRLFPQEQFAEVRFPKLTPVNHYGQFIDAVRGEGKTEAPLDGYGCRLVETVLLGAVAQHLPGQAVEYDGTSRRFTTQVPEALLSRPYRSW